MKKIFVAVVIFAFGSAKAQTDPIYAQYLNNPVVLNPAYSGFSKNLSGNFSYRKQWAGFEGSPETMSAVIHSSLNNNKVGAGLLIMQDKIGNVKNTDVIASYAYKISSDEMTISFGLQAGFTQFRSNDGELNVYDPNGNEFWINQNFTKPLFGAGIIVSSDRYFIGASVPRLLKTSLDIDGDEVEVYKQHFYMMASYIVFVNDEIKFKPSILFRRVQGSPLSLDYNMLVNFKDRYSVGAFSRSFNTYGVLAQLRLNDRYRLGYAFEVPTNKSVGTRFTTHELVLGINLSVFNFHDQAQVSSF